MGDMDSKGIMGGGDAEEPAEKEESPITFKYAKGTLTINMPEEKEDTAAVEEKPAPNPQEQAMAEGMMQGMLPMFKGMRMRFMIKVPSAIKKTNAKHVSANRKTKKKQFVTLMDFSMDKLLAGEGGMKAFMQLQEEKDKAKILDALAEAGMKIEPSEKVTISF